MKFWLIGLIALLFIADRWLKYLVLASPHTFRGDFLMLHLNEGIAFSLSIPSPYLVILLVAGLTALVWTGARELKKPQPDLFPFGLIGAGASSNIIDRVWVGAVIDYFSLPRIGLYWNIADIMIVGGLILLVWRQRYSPQP